jgi:hypothetical protein
MMFVSVAAETASLERLRRHFRCTQASGLQERNEVEFIRNGVTRTECSALGWYPFEAVTDLAEGRRSQSSTFKERIRGNKSLDFSLASFLSICRVVCDGWRPSIHSIAPVRRCQGNDMSTLDAERASKSDGCPWPGLE